MVLLGQLWILLRVLGRKQRIYNFLSYSRGSCCETKAQLQRTALKNISTKKTFGVNYKISNTN
jgi:hypothetical protein